MLENHIKTQIPLRESIYERGVLGCLRFYCAIQQLKNLTGFYAYWNFETSGNFLVTGSILGLYCNTVSKSQGSTDLYSNKK